MKFESTIVDDETLLKVIRDVAAPAIQELARRGYAVKIDVTPQNAASCQDILHLVSIEKLRSSKHQS